MLPNNRLRHRQSDEGVTADGVGRRDSASASPTPKDFTLAKDEEGEAPVENAGAEQVLAADYDPSLDRREDERKRFGDKARPLEIDEEEEEAEEEEDVDDMFAVAFAEKKPAKKKKVIVRQFLALFFSNY